MSALPLKADMLGVGINVCFVPIADLTSLTLRSPPGLRRKPNDCKP